MSEPAVVVNARCLTQPMTGTQRYAYNIIRHLPQLRLIAPGPPAAQYSAVSPGRVKVVPHLFGSHLWEQLVLPTQVHNGDLLWSPSGLGSLLVNKYVITITDLAVYENPFCYGRMFGAWYRAMYPRVVKSARRVLTISDFSASVIERVLNVPRERIAVTHLGVDPVFRPRANDDIVAMRERLGVPEQYVLAVGAVSPRKNLPRLLDSWRRISPSLPGVQLVLVAEQNFISLGNSTLGELPANSMQLTGVSDDTLSLLYAGATVFVYPSIYEGFGLPPIEAMASGAAVITSNVTSLPEVAGDAAILVDPLDVDAIADAIASVVRTPTLRDELRTRGFRRAAAFSWKKTAQQTWDVLQAALN